MKGVFHLSAYRRLLAAYTLNELAWSFGTLALAVLVYRRTGSALGTMAFFLCVQFAPALASPGLVARLDQSPRRQVLVSLYALEAIAFLVLAWLTSRFSLAPVLALAFVDGVLAVSARAIARATTAGVLTPVGLLREGNAVTNASFSICYMAGPVIAGAIVVTGGTTAALLVNAGLFAAITLVLAAAELPGGVAEPEPSMNRLRSAIATAWRTVEIRNLLCLQVGALVFFTMAIPVVVVLAQDSLHAGAGGYGALLSSWGAGAVAGSLVFARWRRKPMRALIVVSACLAGVGFGVIASAPGLAVAIVGAVIGGVGNGLQTAAVQTAVQEAAQRRWMGMMMSVLESVNQATPGVGIVIGGAIAALSSPRITLAVAGGGALLVAAAAWLGLRPAAAGALARQPVA